MLDRRFDQPEPGRAWVSDITYVPTGEGWLYVAVVIDLCTRKVIDNAVAESFFATLKRECVNRHAFATRADATARIVQYIETFYNRTRRHSALGYLSPADFERTLVA